MSKNEPWQPPLNDDGSLSGLPVSYEEAIKNIPRCDVCNELTATPPCFYAFRWEEGRKSYVHTYCLDSSRWIKALTHFACQAHRKLREDVDNLLEVKARRVLRVMRAAWEGRLVKNRSKR